MSHGTIWKKWVAIGTAILMCSTSSLVRPLVALAAALTNLSVTMDDGYVDHTGTNYTMAFTTATTPSSIQRIAVKFSTLQNGSTVPLGLNLSGAQLVAISGLTTSGWTLDLSDISSGLVSATRTTPAIAAGATAIGMYVTGITNSTHNACQGAASHSLDDSCFAQLTTYSSQDTSAPIDTGAAVYTMQEDPMFTLEIDGITSGQLHNGITATATSTATALPFGRVRPGSVSYVAHKLIVTTNAPNGYSVYSSLDTPITGQYSQAQVYPFGATNATWSTPQIWMSPTGTLPNNNTAWFGANTTDTRVTGWSGNTSSKFGPLNTTPRMVAYSTLPDRTGATVYVTYAFGINSLQASDIYSGVILYQVVPSY